MVTQDAVQLFLRTEKLMGSRYRLERLVAASAERVLFLAVDTLLNRRVSLRVNFFTSTPLRRWFLAEAEALAQLDHRAIRHVYDAGIVDDAAFRIGNWIDGEGLHEATARGPRPIPSVHALARDLLGALEHAHTRGLMVRRMVPASILISPGGRGTVTDLRFCSYVLPSIPADEVVTGTAFMAPEVRGGQPGEPPSDVFTAAAVLYYAITGTEPPADPGQITSPSRVRPATPAMVERILMRALHPDPDRRFMTAAEMLEEFMSVAGSFDSASVSEGPSGSLMQLENSSTWEKRLRRALGDDYELLGDLGSGGFGRVYRVRDLHLERMVALKVLHPLLTQDPGVVERFRREAQLAARLNHPQIVNIYDIGGRSGLIWYTMEMVDGPNLAQLVERDGPLPLDRVARLLREGLDALGHAHGAGLVHRDIKPENMLLERRDGSLRITDFGLALALLGQGKWGGATSQSGTPQFASPEQLLGERVDQRSDLYSLAAVAVYALMGEPPFSGFTPEQVLAKQTTNRLPDLGASRADVGPELIAVLERALRAEVTARFPTAGEFLQALNRALRRDQQRGRNRGWLPRLFRGRAG
jgi:serine/threonine protein kinase